MKPDKAVEKVERQPGRLPMQNTFTRNLAGTIQIAQAGQQSHFPDVAVKRRIKQQYAKVGTKGGRTSRWRRVQPLPQRTVSGNGVAVEGEGNGS